MKHELPQPNQARPAIIVPASRALEVDREAGRRFWATVALLNETKPSPENIEAHKLMDA